MAMYLPIATNLFHYISVSPKQLTVTQLVGCGFAVIGSGTVVVGCAVVVVGCGVVNSKQTFIEFSTSDETIKMTVQRDIQLASTVVKEIPVTIPHFPDIYYRALTMSFMNKGRYLKPFSVKVRS